MNYPSVTNFWEESASSIISLSQKLGLWGRFILVPSFLAQLVHQPVKVVLVLGGDLLALHFDLRIG